MQLRWRRRHSGLKGIKLCVESTRVRTWTRSEALHDGQRDSLDWSDW